MSDTRVRPVPRLRVAPPCHTNDVQDVVDLMAAYGTTLDPWQVDALEAGLGVRADGEWSAHTYGCNVARQNGKSVILVARVLAGALLFGEKTIVVSAHEQRTCRLLFQELLGYFKLPELKRRVEAVVSALGREEIRLKDGTRILFPSRTRSNLRGFSIDLLLCDEAQLLRDEVWEAARPALAARAGASVWMFGTAPQQSADAEVFGRLRDQAHDGGDGDSAWVEYGADEGCSLDDREQWRKANPGRVTAEAIEAERREMSPGGFARERLNIWPTERTEQVIDSEWWAHIAGDRPAGPPAAFAVDMTPARDAVVVAGAWRRDTGGFYVEVLLVDKDPFAAANYLVEAVRSAGRRTPVVVDGASPARSLEPMLSGQRVMVRVTSAAEMAVACGAFLDDVKGSRVSHGGGDALAAAVEGARRRTIGEGGAFAWDRRDGGVFLSPLVAVTLARFGASTGKVRTGRATFA